MSCAAILLFVLSPFGSVGGQDSPPVPTWPLPGYPNTDGGFRYPLWDGSSYLDSAPSTGAERLWDIGITGKGVSVAVLDTLFDVDHEAIRNSIIAGAAFCGVKPTLSDPESRLLYPSLMQDMGIRTTTNVVTGTPFDYRLYQGEGVDLVAGNSLILDDRYHNPSHGTHVAGIVVGMAPDAGLVLLNTSTVNGRIGEFTIIEDFSDGAQSDAVKWAAQNAARYSIVALNGSYGDAVHRDSHAVADERAPYEAEAIAELAAAGALGIFASGNDGWNNYICSPAAISNAVAVGALHQWGVLTAFSNQNDLVSLIAPGQDIYSSIPPWVNPINNPDGDAYRAETGTSQATPHVSGAVALLASGARNASSSEILAALVASGDRIVYDGSVVLPKEFLSVAGTLGREGTLDEWRESVSGDSAPLRSLEYRFLRVDKAYAYLTAFRTLKQAAAANLRSPAGSAMLAAYAGELHANIDKDASDIFQRLDAQPIAGLTTASRRMSPLFHEAGLERAFLGTVGIHRSIGRRASVNRMERGFRSSPVFKPAESAYADINPSAQLARPAFTAWLDGFGGYARRDGDSSSSSDYSGHFSGASLGIERRQDGVAFGLFGSWADLKVDGDGRARGDWYTLGAYGHFDFSRFFVEASAAYNFGDYDSTRGIVIPGARFSSYSGPIVYDAIYRQAGADLRVHGVSGRLAAGFEAWEGVDWSIGPLAEVSAAYARVPGFSESGGQSLDLSLDGYGSGYVEGGLGVAASKVLAERGTAGRFIGSARVMGMYGAGFGGGLRGRFSRYGSGFSVRPDRLRTGWCLPEASLTWKANDCFEVSATYAGRFGRGYEENTGMIQVKMSW